MEKYLITAILWFFVGDATAQVLSPVQGSYLKTLRVTADSLNKIVTSKDIGATYFITTDALYTSAIQITGVEDKRQTGTSNAAFTHILLQILNKLRRDLSPDQPKLSGLHAPKNFAITVKAALNNFNRYEIPPKLNQEQAYLWALIQVFENLDQINVAFLQADLSKEQRKSVIQRLTVQQNIINQLKQKSLTN